MAHPSIQSGGGKPELNPAMLFQATPSPETQGGNFEAALNRAQQPERPQNASPERPADPERAPPKQEVRSDTPRERSDAPAEQSPSPEIARTTEATPTDEQAPADETKDLAGVPAEIAAILTAIAALTQRTQAADADTGIDPARLATVFGDQAKGKNGGSQPKGFDFLFGKDPAPQIGLNTKETLVQQAVTLVTQATPQRNFAEHLMAGLRGDAAAGTQGAGLPFAARGDLAQHAAQLPQLPVSTPAGQRAAWATDVGNQVAWMLGRNESKAELVLTPPNLGKLGVSIQVNGEQTTAHFVAATQAAREALEQAMPRLREVLQQAGIQLGEAQVSTSGEQRTHDGGDNRSVWGQRGDGAGDDALSAGDAPATQIATWTRSGNGVIDTFA